METVHRRHRAAGVDLSAQVVETLQQTHPVIEPTSDVLVQRDVLDLEVRLVRIAANAERTVFRTEIRRPLGVGMHAFAAAVGAGHAIRQAQLISFPHLRHDGNHGRRVVDRFGWRLGNAAGHHPLASTAVIAEGVSDAADHGVLVGALRVPRHEFTDIEASHIRLDRMKRTAIFRGSVGLHVIHVQVRRTSREPDEKDRRIGRRGHLTRFGPQTHHVGQAQPAQAQCPEFQNRPPRNGTDTRFQVHSLCSERNRLPQFSKLVVRLLGTPQHSWTSHFHEVLDLIHRQDAAPDH